MFDWYFNLTNKSNFIDKLTRFNTIF